MKYIPAIATRFMTVISLLTALGVFMHDGRVDKATTIALKGYQSSPIAEKNIAARVKAFAETDAHTHPDHNAARSLINSFAYKSPSVAPRRSDNKQNVEIEVKGGRHAFDNASLPIIT